MRIESIKRFDFSPVGATVLSCKASPNRTKLEPLDM